MNLDNGDRDRLLTIKEVSDLTGLAIGTIYHFVSELRIPVVRFSSRCIRFRLSALEQWFEELTEEAGPHTVCLRKSKLAKGKARMFS